MDETAYHTGIVKVPFISFNLRDFSSGFPESGYTYDVESVGVSDALGAEDGGCDFMSEDATKMRKSLLKFLSTKIHENRPKDPVKKVKIIYLTTYWSSRDYWGEYDAGMDVVGQVELTGIQNWITREQVAKKDSYRRYLVRSFIQKHRSAWKYRYKYALKRKVKAWQQKLGLKSQIKK